MPRRETSNPDDVAHTPGSVPLHEYYPELDLSAGHVLSLTAFYPLVGSHPISLHSSMRIDYLYLLLAVALLWLPLALLFGRRVRRELRNPARGVLVTLPALLRSPWSWVDLLRATGGVWILNHLVYLPPPPTAKPTPAILLALRIGLPLVLFIGVWIQTMLTGSRRLRLAPLFYLLGITIAMLLPFWQVSFFGGVLGLTLTGMLRRWQLAFWLLPATLLAAALLFKQIGIPVILVALLYMLPGLLGLRPERRLSWVFTQTNTLPSTNDKPRRRRRRSDGLTSSAKL